MFHSVEPPFSGPPHAATAPPAMLVKGYSRLLPFGRSSTAKLSHQGSFHQQESTYTVTVEIGTSGRLGILTSKRPDIAAYPPSVSVVVRELLPGSPAWVARIVALRRQHQQRSGVTHSGATLPPPAASAGADARRAGCGDESMGILQPGDVLLKVNSTSLLGLSHAKALEVMRQETAQHAVVTLTLQRVPTETRHCLGFHVIFPEASVDATSPPPSLHVRHNSRRQSFSF